MFKVCVVQWHVWACLWSVIKPQLYQSSLSNLVGASYIAVTQPAVPVGHHVLAHTHTYPRPVRDDTQRGTFDDLHTLPHAQVTAHLCCFTAYVNEHTNLTEMSIAFGGGKKEASSAKWQAWSQKSHREFDSFWRKRASTAGWHVWVLQAELRWIIYWEKQKKKRCLTTVSRH